VGDHELSWSHADHHRSVAGAGVWTSIIASFQSVIVAWQSPLSGSVAELGILSLHDHFQPFPTGDRHVCDGANTRQLMDRPRGEIANFESTAKLAFQSVERT
jgi:hypothetical protein